jgi:uncharacterized RDD family membrane protein YckC
MDSTPEVAAEDPNILDDVQYILYQASGGKRFANYLVDRISFYVLWRIFAVSLSPTLVHYLYLIFHDQTLVILIWYSLYALTFVLIIAGMETVTGGKTLGKYLTRTRAVNDDGSRITGKTALLRCLSRLVPFEAFSALGNPSYPWHDRWTKTVVIDENLTTLPPQV